MRIIIIILLLASCSPRQAPKSIQKDTQKDTMQPWIKNNRPEWLKEKRNAYPLTRKRGNQV